MIKILHILDHSIPLHSGYTFRSQNIFQAQKKMGYDPVIITSPKHEESLKQKIKLIEEIKDFTYYRTGPVDISSLPMVSELKIIYALYNRILEVAEIEKPDIIHVHSPILNGIPAIKAARKLNIPVVYEIRAFWEDAAVDHGTYAENSWKYKLAKFIETQVCKRANHIGILCNGLKNDLVSRGIPESKITPIFNGVNPDDLQPVAPDKEYIEQWKLKNKKIIGFIGSFYRYEGLDLLIEAFAKISEEHKTAMLLLVGGGEMEQELKMLAKKNHVDHRIVMPGRIPHEKIAGVYSMIDILVYPRYSIRLTELVTPLKPLEAMSMGRSLIASDVGGHKELIEDNKTGLLFEAGNVEDLSEKIDLIFQNKNLATSLQMEGLKWVNQNHTWEETTSVYNEIYDSIFNA